jgi:hypothetical protein
MHAVVCAQIHCHCLCADSAESHGPSGASNQLLKQTRCCMPLCMCTQPARNSTNCQPVSHLLHSAAALHTACLQLVLPGHPSTAQSTCRDTTHQTVLWMGLSRQQSRCFALPAQLLHGSTSTGTCLPCKCYCSNPGLLPRRDPHPQLLPAVPACLHTPCAARAMLLLSELLSKQECAANKFQLHEGPVCY